MYIYCYKYSITILYKNIFLLLFNLRGYIEITNFVDFFKRTINICYNESVFNLSDIYLDIDELLALS